MSDDEENLFSVKQILNTILSNLNPSRKKNTVINPIKKITALECVNDSNITKLSDINFDYNVVDKNGNTILIRLIAQYNLNAIEKIFKNTRVCTISSKLNNQGLNSLQFTVRNLSRIANNYTDNNIKIRLDGYNDILKKSIGSNSQFAGFEFGEDNFVQAMVYACLKGFDKIMKQFRKHGRRFFGGAKENDRKKEIIADYNKFDEGITIFDLTMTKRKSIFDVTMTKLANLNKTINDENISKTEIFRIINIFRMDVPLIKEFYDYDKYENSTHNKVNDIIIEIITENIIKVFATDFINALSDYFVDNTKIIESNKEIETCILDVLKQSMYIKINLRNPEDIYPDITYLKELLISKIYETTTIVKNADDDKILNLFIEYYCYLSDNISYNSYYEIYDYMDCILKLDILINIYKVISDSFKEHCINNELVIKPALHK